MSSLSPPCLNLTTTCFPSSSENESCLGPEPREESRHPEGTQESSPCCGPMDGQAEPPSLPVTAGMGHTEEPVRSAEATRELHAQPWHSAGSRSGDAWEDDSRQQLPQTQAGRDVASVGGPTAAPTVSLTGESVLEPLISAGSALLAPAPAPEGQYSQAQRKGLRLPLKDASEAWPPGRLEDSEFNELRQLDLTDRDGKSLRGPPDPERAERALRESNQESDLSAGGLEVCMAPEERGGEDERVNKETEDYLNSLLEGCLKDAEDSLSCQDNQEEDSDLLPDLSPDEASYSLQEDLPSDESSLSLDDLAKRIEIAEVRVGFNRRTIKSTMKFCKYLSAK